MFTRTFYQRRRRRGGGSSCEEFLEVLLKAVSASGKNRRKEEADVESRRELRSQTRYTQIAHLISPLHPDPLRATTAVSKNLSHVTSHVTDQARVSRKRKRRKGRGRTEVTSRNRREIFAAISTGHPLVSSVLRLARNSHKREERTDRTHLSFPVESATS